MLSLEAVLWRLGRDHDLLLVEGHKDTPLPKFWLGSAEALQAPDSVTNVVGLLAWNGPRLAAFMEYIDRWLPAAWNARPLYRGLLVGGKSSRMGSPKQLLRFGGRALGEIAAWALAAGGDDYAANLRGNPQVVALGQERLPESPKTLCPVAGSAGLYGTRSRVDRGPSMGSGSGLDRGCVRPSMAAIRAH